jgi:3-oxoadipate enol-lactonase
MPARLQFDCEGRGVPLVLLHPVGLDRHFWGPLVERASGLRKLIALDLPGHGDSPLLGEYWTIAEYAKSVYRTLDDLIDGYFEVLGLSFGGMIAQELALLAPQSVSRLIVGACPGVIPPGARDGVRARGEKALASGMASVVDETLSRWFTPDFLRAPEVQRVKNRLLTNDVRGWAAGWFAISSFNALERLSQLQVPALVIAAELDAGTPVAATRAIADALPRSSFALLENAPHMMHIERADAFTALVLDYLKS